MKSDVKATRKATDGLVFAGRTRLRGIILGAPNTTTAAAATLLNGTTGSNYFQVDAPAGDVVFPKGIYVSTFTVAAVTLLTDKYSGPNLTAG
jgi:hypothetical protein